MNWFKRYINFKYDDFWTLTLDKLFKINPHNRITILNYGSEFLTYTNAYPRKNVSQEIGRLHLSLFLASHDLAG